MSLIYAEYSYYTTEYGGTLISEAEWPRLARAEMYYLDEITFGRIAELTDIPDAVRDCVCALCEYAQQSAGTEDIVSERVGEVTVTYGVAGRSGNDTFAKITAHKYAIAKQYLGRTGLLYVGGDDGGFDVKNALSVIRDAVRRLFSRSVPSGGDAGQVLAKAGDDDYNTEWVYASAGGGEGTTNYNALTHKPKIGGVELSGDKTPAALGLAPADVTTTKVSRAGDTMTGDLSFKAASVVLDVNAKLKGDDGTVKHTLISTKQRTVRNDDGTTTVVRDLDINGDMAMHLNLGTSDDPEYNEHITYNTPSGVKLIPNRHDFDASQSFYIDSHYKNKIAPNGSIVYPYKTWGAFLEAYEAAGRPTGIEVDIRSGSDLSSEEIALHNVDGAQVFSEAAPDLQDVTVARIGITGTTTNVGVKGLKVLGNTTLAASGDGALVFDQMEFDGEIVSNPQGDGQRIRSFEKCCFRNDITLGGEGEVEFGFYEGWTYEKEDDTMPAVVINNPDATVYISNCIDFSLKILQCKLVKVVSTNLITSGLCPLYSLEVDEGCMGVIELVSGTTRNDETRKLNPIKIGGGCQFMAGTFEFARVGSDIRGTFESSGIGSIQVRDNDEREGYTPFIDPRDTYGIRTSANTLKDHLNGISVGIEAASRKDETDIGLTFTGSANEYGEVTGGWKFAMTNESTAGSVIIKDCWGNDWLNFDVAALAAAGLQAVVGVRFNDPYWKPRADYEVGQIVNYEDRGYEVIAPVTGSIAPHLDIATATPHYKLMDNWGLDNYRNIEPYTDFVVAVDGRVWLCKDQIQIDTDLIDAFLAHTDSTPLVVHGATWICMSPAMPSSTPGEYLMFVMADNTVTFASMSSFGIAGTQTISITDRKISVICAPNSGLEAKDNGLGFASGYRAMTTAEGTKIGALPDNAELNTLLAAKVDKVTGQGLSTNDYVNADKAKLAALPDNATLTTNLSAKENTTNKATAISTASTDTQYPSAKAVMAAITAAIPAVLQNCYYDTAGKVTATFNRELKSNPSIFVMPGTTTMAGSWAHTSGSTGYTFTPTTNTQVLYGDWSVTYNGGL